MEYYNMNVKKRLSSFNVSLLYVMYFLILMPDFLNSIWHGAKLSSWIIRGIAGIVSLSIIVLKKNKSKAIVNLSIYIIYILMVSVFKNFGKATIIRYIAIYSDIFMVAVLTDYLLRKDSVLYIKVMNKVAWIGLLLNAATVFLLPDGIVRVANDAGDSSAPYYFYDYDNRFIVSYIVSFSIMYIYGRYCRKDKKDFKLLIALLIGLSTVVKQHSSSSTMAMIFLIIAYFLIGIFPEKLISIKSTWAAYIMTSIMIALGVTTMAGAKLISYLGKATSFLKRTTMWAIAMNKIPKNFILGTGVISSIEMKNTFGYAQLHNSALTTVLWGG